MGDDVRQEGAFPQVGEGADGPGGEPDDVGGSERVPGHRLEYAAGRPQRRERFPRPRLYTTAPKRMAQKGDVMMSVRAPVGDLNVALEDCCIGRGLAALHHKSGSFSFGLYQIQSLKPVLDLFNGEGTVFGSINQKDLKAINVLQPTNTIISLFNDRCLSIDEQIQNNTRQNILLSETRDIMLPKLLNGDIEA